MLWLGRMANNSLIEVVDIGAPGGGGSESSRAPSMTGIELLMNDRGKTPPANKTGSSDAVIQSLERDLNNLSNLGYANDPSPMPASASAVRPIQLTVEKETPSLGNNDPFTTVLEASAVEQTPIKIGLGSDLASSIKGGSTWDGYSASTDSPANIVITGNPTKQEVLREKFSYLRKLEAMERKGLKLTKHYSMESGLEEMKGEYEMIVSEKEKEASVRFQAKMLMACVTGITFLNQRFDPFDVNLEGWDETVQENVTDYDDVFAELHEKYRSKAKIAPELKLLFMLGGSAVMAHMGNTMFKSAVPGVDDLLRENPDLMRQFTAAAATSMAGSKPGLSSFLGEFGPPMPQSGAHAPHAGRPDLDIRAQEPGMPMDNQEASVQNGHNRTPRVRPEMTGPRDITDILSRLKTKPSADTDTSSRISVGEAIGSASPSTRQPSKSKRRPNSEKSVNLVM
jgi:hypothetical protein